MNRRTIITILIAVLVALGILALWFTFFNGSPSNNTAKTGTFGTGGSRTATSTTTSVSGNIPSSVGQSSSTGGSASLSGSGSLSGGLTYVGSTGTTSTSAGVNPNASWLTGTGGVGGGSGVPFNPATINQLNNGQVGGSVNVLGTFSNPDTNGSGGGLGGAVGAIAGTAVACTAFLVQGQAAGLLPSLGVVKTTDTTDASKNFMDCLARTIARAAIQQITNSVVNWINSGFNGQPSFVTNYQQFFASVADQAAGSFIQNYTNFAPYCTPFAKQIQIALATSYARRGSGGQSCSLSQLLGTNTQGLFSGKGLNSNGWSNLVQFTTNSSNNPYAAYMSAQINLANAQSGAAANANRNISPSGFLNFQQSYDCQNPSQNGGGGVSAGSSFSSQTLGYSCPQGCKCRVTTPGSVIESSLNKTLGNSLDSLNLAKSFDEIISALITQLMTRALQGGVSNLSGQSGYASYYLTPDQQAAQSGGSDLLTTLQGYVVLAQQYGQSEQGSIQDVENTQSQLTNLANCWQTAASSTPEASSTQQGIATSNMQSALTTLHSYDPSVAMLNAQITRANQAVATLQTLQTQTLSVGSTADVSTVQTALNAAIAQGQIVSQADVTQAQQDRTTLQAGLALTNQQTANQLQQCYAF